MMIKLVTIIGARPQIIKAAAISREISLNFQEKVTEIIVHTGQHYDENMSGVFFEELGIPKPHYNLGVGSLSHGAMTALMIEGIEKILISESPDALLIYGDTNSTLAGAIAASKLHVPVIHIEAGLRSFNKSMPEEINRIMADHVSTLLFSPTLTGVKNLENEGIPVVESGSYTANKPGVFHCGDIMFDNSLYFAGLADRKDSLLNDLEIENNDFVLATIHRDHNTDNATALTSIFEALNEISLLGQYVVLPLHPRTKSKLSQQLPADLLKTIQGNKRIKIIPPVSFLEMILLEKRASLLLTDSGGVQKEAYFFEKPVVILRPETEWTEILEAGTGLLAGSDKTQILNAYHQLASSKNLSYPPVFGDGKAANFILNTIFKQFANQ
jgi:UDP-GlcNAc3NAcA epimerase